MGKHLKGFLEFVREQGVIGLAIRIILGGAVAKVVAALVTDIINPLIGVILGNAAGLKEMTVSVGSARLLVGDFISILIDFVVVALVVYVTVKVLGFDRLDRKKEDKKDAKKA